jgi:hypothetical protein
MTGERIDRWLTPSIRLGIDGILESSIDREGVSGFYQQFYHESWITGISWVRMRFAIFEDVDIRYVGTDLDIFLGVLLWFFPL